MNKKLVSIPIGNKPKKKQLFQSRFRFIWNRIGQMKKSTGCFGCGDSLWWKENVAMAYTEHEPNEYQFGDYSPEVKEKLQELKLTGKADVIFLGIRSGVNICRECFINKSERELIEIFETVAKPRWMKGKSLEQVEKIRNYNLYIPIRTTGQIFKKEM